MGKQRLPKIFLVIGEEDLISSWDNLKHRKLTLEGSEAVAEEVGIH
ncbi:MAG: hypothetical protein P0S93_01000 [Candidatus Neptunochlamydia sp.]|nr:hypothetical protein [Candidatus Neptunochlamydia sp.]